jgi:hypothetical protein
VCHCCCCVMSDRLEDDRLWGHPIERKNRLGRLTDTDTYGNCVHTVIRQEYECQDGWETDGPTDEEYSCGDTLLYSRSLPWDSLPVRTDINMI